MASDRPRFSITVSSEMYKYINDYQHANKLATQTKAIAQILQIGLDTLEAANEIQTTKKFPAPAEPEAGERDSEYQALLESITHSFDRLNMSGKEQLNEYAGMLLKEEKYLMTEHQKEQKPVEMVRVWQAARSVDNSTPSGWVERPKEEIEKIFNAPDADVDF